MLSTEIIAQLSHPQKHKIYVRKSSIWYFFTYIFIPNNTPK